MKKIEFAYNDNIITVNKDMLFATSPEFKNAMMKEILKSSAIKYKESGKMQVEYCMKLSKHLNKLVAEVSDEVFNKEIQN